MVQSAFLLMALQGQTTPSEAFIVSRLNRHSVEFLIASPDKPPRTLLSRRFTPFRPGDCTERWAQLVTFANLVAAVHPNGKKILIPYVQANGRELTIEISTLDMNGTSIKYPKIAFRAQDESCLFFGWDQGLPHVGIVHRSGEEKFYRLSRQEVGQIGRRPISLESLRKRPWEGGPVPIARILGSAQWVTAEHWPSWPHDTWGAGYPARRGRVFSMSSRESVVLTDGQSRSQFKGVNARFVQPLDSHSFIGSIIEGKNSDEFRHLLSMPLLHDKSVVKMFDCRTQSAVVLADGLFGVPVAKGWLITDPKKDWQICAKEDL